MRRLLLLAAVCLFVLCGSAQVNTQRMMQVGRNALFFDDYVLGIQYFNRVIVAKPYLAEPYYWRGVAKFYLGDLGGAAGDCDHALDINPFLLEAYNLRGICRLRQGQANDALDDFRTALRYEPDNVNLMLNSGIAHINLKDYDRAVAAYDSLLRRDRNNVQAHLYRGIALVERGDTTAALAAFVRAKEINKYSPEAHTYIGMLKFGQGDYRGALESYDALQRLRPKDAQVYVNRGICRYQLDDLRGCQADLDEALRLDRKNKMAWVDRGLLRAEAGLLAEAADDFSHALALDPTDELVLFNRAMVYLDLGEMRSALADLDIIVAEHPDFSLAYQARARARRALGDNAGAERDMALCYELERQKEQKALNNNEQATANKEQGTEEGGKKGSRGAGDRDQRKWRNLVVVADFGEQDANLTAPQESAIRGRVQDRDIAIDLEPIFQLTFFSADTLLPNAPYYRTSVETFNRGAWCPRRLMITNRERGPEEVSLELSGLLTAASRDIEHDGEHAEQWMLRGSLRLTMGDYQGAIDDLTTALRLQPDDVNALFNRAAARYHRAEALRDAEPQNEQFDGAMMAGANKPQQAAVPLAPANNEGLLWRAVADDLEAVLRLEPANEFALYNLSLVAAQRKDWTRALQLLEEALQNSPLLAEAYYNRGIIEIYQGHDEAGSADLSRAGELGLFKAYNVIKRFGKE